MSTKVQITKRLEMIKSAIELQEEEFVHEQIIKLKQEKNPNLTTIIKILENDEYDKINEAIDNYVLGYKNATMTPHQQTIFDQVTTQIYHLLENIDTIPCTANARFISLKGSAGVGKTFVASKIIEDLVKHEYSVTLTTPTHKSLQVAKYMLNVSNHHIPAQTLHSFLDIKLTTDYNEGIISFTRHRSTMRFNLETPLDILIVDESSMISKTLLSFIEEDLHLKKLKVVLFIGDQYQLPPIDEGTNPVTTLPKQYELTEIVRQAENSYIKKIAIELKQAIQDQHYPPIMSIFDKNKYPNLTLYNEEAQFLSHLTNQPNWYNNKNMILAYSNAQVNKHNIQLRNTYWHQKNTNPTENIIIGDRLLAGENDYNITNSEIIKVTSATKHFNPTIKIHYWKCLEENGRTFSLVDPDDEAIYNEYLYQLSNQAKAYKKRGMKSEATQIWKKYFAIKAAYGEFRYAFAITVHKSQGSTYNTSYINLSNIVQLIAGGKDIELGFRLLYVAVTRASKNLVVQY